MISFGLGFLVGLMAGEVLTMLMIMFMSGRDTSNWKAENSEHEKINEVNRK